MEKPQLDTGAIEKPQTKSFEVTNERTGIRTTDGTTGALSNVTSPKGK